MKIGIIGGKGKFGRWFQLLFKGWGAEVELADFGTRLSNNEVAKRNEVILVAVPLQELKRVLNQIRGDLTGDKLLVDIASVKLPFIDTFESLPSQIVLLHPMFAPTQAADCQGQLSTFWTLRDGDLTEEFLSRLTQHLQLVEIDPTEHDRMMSLIQGLSHSFAILLGLTLGSLGLKPQVTRSLASPIYRIQLDLAARVLGHDPKLYREIAMLNDQTGEVLKIYQEHLTQLADTVTNLDRQGYDQLFCDARDVLAPIIDDSQRESSELIEYLLKGLNQNRDS